MLGCILALNALIGKTFNLWWLIFLTSLHAVSNRSVCGLEEGFKSPFISLPFCNVSTQTFTSSLPRRERGWVGSQIKDGIQHTPSPLGPPPLAISLVLFSVPVLFHCHKALWAAVQAKIENSFPSQTVLLPSSCAKSFCLL